MKLVTLIIKLPWILLSGLAMQEIMNLSFVQLVISALPALNGMTKVQVMEMLIQHLNMPL